MPHLTQIVFQNTYLQVPSQFFEPVDKASDTWMIGGQFKCRCCYLKVIGEWGEMEGGQYPRDSGNRGFKRNSLRGPGVTLRSLLNGTTICKTKYTSNQRIKKLVLKCQFRVCVSVGLFLHWTPSRVWQPWRADLWSEKSSLDGPQCHRALPVPTGSLPWVK